MPVPQINSSRDTATRLLRLAHLPCSSHERSGSTKVSPPLPVEIRDLSFAYPSRIDQDVLRSINLEIAANSSIAVVGASGSGKSTVASLLVGFYPVPISPSNSSTITYNGVPGAEVDIYCIRSQIAVVSQQPVLFPTTIAANIAYGLPTSTDDGSGSKDNDSAVTEVWKTENCTAYSISDAAKQAGIHDFIMSLPHSYATVIGDGGQGLSGGQAQRIAIARALVRKPKLLILDEATSSLDSENAQLIRDTVTELIRSSPNATPVDGSDGLAKRSALNDSVNGGGGGGGGGDSGMAVLIITHSKEMMKIAEKIVVLDQGRVVEQGSWQELMSSRRGRRGQQKGGSKTGGGALQKLLSSGERQGVDGATTPLRTPGSSHWRNENWRARASRTDDAAAISEDGPGEITRSNNDAHERGGDGDGDGGGGGGGGGGGDDDDDGVGGGGGQGGGQARGSAGKGRPIFGPVDWEKPS